MALAPLIFAPDPASLGAPQLKVAGLELWVHDRRSPQAQDYWEGNWLVVTVRCAAHGATIWTTGPMLRVPDLVRWADALDRLHARGGPEGVATLTSDERQCRAIVKAYPVRDPDGAHDV